MIGRVNLLRVIIRPIRGDKLVKTLTVSRNRVPKHLLDVLNFFATSLFVSVTNNQLAAVVCR